MDANETTTTGGRILSASQTEHATAKLTGTSKDYSTFSCYDEKMLDPHVAARPDLYARNTNYPLNGAFTNFGKSINHRYSLAKLDYTHISCNLTPYLHTCHLHTEPKTWPMHL
jgi:hypothetical protein